MANPPNTITINAEAVDTVKPLQYCHPNTGVWQDSPTLTNVTPGTYNQILVRLKNSNPAIEKTWTVAVIVTGPPGSTTLLAPASFAAGSMSSSTAPLTWAAVTGASSYEILRATNTSFTTGVVTLTAAAGATSFTDTSLNPSTTYYWKIRAMGNGTTLLTSGYSAYIQKATTALPASSQDMFIIVVAAQSNWSSQAYKDAFLPGGSMASISPPITRQFDRFRLINGNVAQKLQMSVNDYFGGSSSIFFGHAVALAQAFENALTGQALLCAYALDGTPLINFTKQGVPIFGGGFDNSAYNEIIRQINVGKAIWASEGRVLTADNVKFISQQGESHADDDTYVAMLGQLVNDIVEECTLPTGCRGTLHLTASQTDSHNNTIARQNLQTFCDTYTNHTFLPVDAEGYNLQDDYHWDGPSHVKHAEEQIKALLGLQPLKWYISPTYTCPEGQVGAPVFAASTQSKLAAIGIAQNNLSCSVVSGEAPAVTGFTPEAAYLHTPVIITGTNFTGASSVKFGGIEATSFVVNSATQITAYIPVAWTNGTITVETPAGLSAGSTGQLISYDPTSLKGGPSYGISRLPASYSGVLGWTATRNSLAAQGPGPYGGYANEAIGISDAPVIGYLEFKVITATPSNPANADINYFIVGLTDVAPPQDDSFTVIRWGFQHKWGIRKEGTAGFGVAIWEGPSALFLQTLSASLDVYRATILGPNPQNPEDAERVRYTKNGAYIYEEPFTGLGDAVLRFANGSNAPGTHIYDVFIGAANPVAA